MYRPGRPELTAEVRGADSSRRGIALPAAMFTLVGMAVLVSGMYTFTNLGARSVRNRESAARATHVAEAGMNHALGLLRGSLRMHGFSRILMGADNVTGSLATQADDSLFINWPGLSAGDQIPLAGQNYQGHTYFVTFADDPADTDGNPRADMNGRIRVRCRAVTTDGATAEVDGIVAAVPMAAVATQGNTTYSGTPEVRGGCGSIHANGNLHASSNASVQTLVTATGTAGGNWKLPNGSDAPELSSQPAVPIPSLTPMNHCGGADYRLRADGFVIPTATGTPENANGSEKYGWKRSSSSPVKWELKDALAVPGTFCVEGNAVISGNTGTVGSPLKMSIVASGSIEISGNPFLTSDHDDGILLLAGGDLAISGTPVGGSDNFSGLAYAGAQCKTSGDFTIFGQLMCANGAQPAGSINHISTHDMSGNWKINFDCSANVFNKRRILYWYPRIGV